MNLSTALRVQPNDVVALVGAGGKTTALFHLADELSTRGERVIVTTTTRFGKSQITPHAVRLTPHTPRTGFIDTVKVQLDINLRVWIIGEDLPDAKVAGVPPEFIDHLAREQLATIVYEADGAHMRAFKAPAPHEPVIAATTTLVVPVVGASIFGKALDADNVHRPAMAAQLAGANPGDVITPLVIARVLAHREGGLKNKPSNARAIALINQVDDDLYLNDARTLARLLLDYDSIDAVAIGAAQNENPIRETHRRVAVIVLAAGAGTRMSGRIKQLLPWRGHTLVENAIQIAAQSNAHETLVVLGAHVDALRPIVEKMPARVVLNRAWEGGHSTSIRAGLNALAHNIDAAIFMNADQPLLTPAVIDALIQRYRETDASIIAAQYAGRRGSPVLFDRKHFGELLALQGEQGGRELLANYPVVAVEFADARLGIDIDTLEEYEKLTR
jgi:molybdenum cofactor cytidylyltransferase